jgi:SAM-dependent methyltransferase
MLLFAATIFLSAFLLFLVQPVIAKQILPWFGGSPAVWNTCMVFFQTLLLAGYAYSDWTTRHLTPRAQAMLHAALLALSLVVLPIAADAAWKPAGDEDPVWRILALLSVTIGLPYFLLSSTGPLVQAGFVRRYGGERVYRLFALSNFGSMLALLAYPFLIETIITTHTQAIGWSVAYVVYALMCAFAMILSAQASRHAGTPAGAVSPETIVHQRAGHPTPGDQAIWLALAALGTTLLLSVTNHITQNVASVPLLWLAPLTLYLLSFILCFEGRGWYRRWLFVLLFLPAIAAMAWGLQAEDGVLDIRTAIPLYLVGLFVACMFFHGELARSKPAPRYLTRFYLMISLGGATGGLFVGLLAPKIFAAYYELPVALMVGGLLAAWVLRAVWVVRGLRLVSLAALVATGVAGYQLYKYQRYITDDTVLIARDFFGVLRVQDSGEGKDRSRRLVHGVIMHGRQSYDPEFTHQPTTYYGRTSGIGRTFEALQDRPLKAGVIGLGTGTLAVYGRKGETFRFYDISAKVVEIARREFTYLSESAASIDIVLGDARLAMERETPQDYDIIVVDAFSSDAIPVHLITREALETYLRHLAPGGVIGFHVTNRYLDLRPVVKRLADERGLKTVVVADDGDLVHGASTDWVLLQRDGSLFDTKPFEGATEDIEVPSNLRPWTDDFSNLFQVLK